MLRRDAKFLLSLVLAATGAALMAAALWMEMNGNPEAWRVGGAGVVIFIVGVRAAVARRQRLKAV